MRAKTWSIRILSFAGIAFLVACGGGGGGGYGGGGGGGPVVLFEDDFSSGTFDRWITNIAGATIDGAYGNAIPSAQFFKAAGSGTTAGKITANVNFDPTGGLSFTAHVSNRSTSLDGQLLMFLNTSNGTNTCLAAANVHRTLVQYELRNGGSRPLANNAITPDTSWHTYVLIIQPNGAMTWYRDGSPQLSTPAYAGCVNAVNVLKLEISSAGTSSDEIYFNLDNVEVAR
ncbi:MAG TPA: hypothetical protein VM240_10535 [Verrucomicrobiae bacterium]|nr:hypothetical protein [Verrucomicrobiae bacterium]